MLNIIYFPVFIVILILYFKIAEFYNIVDKPNHRSSHRISTIRGGGIIIPLGVIFYLLLSNSTFINFIIGLFLISCISFYDDIRPLSGKIRIVIHLLSVHLLILDSGLFNYPLWMISISYILIIGTLNAYNFMDGINGITGGYSLIVMFSIWLVNESEGFADQNWIEITVISLLVFNFFNFRTKAKCFAGDVGSVSIAFTILFFILQIIVTTGDVKYIGFLLLYGLDTVTTIVFRLIRKENIFDAHRSHFYQYLANHLHWPHLRVAGLYMFVQLLLSLIILHTSLDLSELVIFFVIIGFLFVGIRYLTEGREVLFAKKSIDLS